MALFKEGRTDADIKDMTYGVSKKGMEDYKEGLKAELLTKVKTKLQAVGDIQKAVDAGWQGEARDAFYKDFGDAIGNVIKHLEKEYEDIEARLNELTNNYYRQDESMYKE